MGNGTTTGCRGRCKDIQLFIKGKTYSIQLFVLDIEVANLILGIKWLQTLGTVTTDYNLNTLSYVGPVGKIAMSGHKQIQKNQYYLPNLQELMMTLDPTTMCLVLSTMTTNLKDKFEEQLIDLSCNVKKIISEYEELFEEPKGLPPIRPIDHTITLIAVTISPNIKPYRYPYYQKMRYKGLLKTC